MSNFNLVTDSRLAKAAYESNNQSGTAVIDGWRPIQVDRIRPGELSPTFGAQLYKNDDTGQYKVVFRGTEGNLADWLENFKYATYNDSPEFRDTVVFMARAVVQVSNEQRKSVSEVVQLFSTTGHSQGGFEAQLASVLFNAKGTSLDGMGALGVVSQFREEFTQIMKDEGVGELAGEHNLGSDGFLTRVYSTVGFLGQQAGTTDGAWSWSLSKIIIALSPSTASAVLAAGLRAHLIADIVANEERRERDPVWRLIGDAGDLMNSPSMLTIELLAEWSRVQVAWNGSGLPTLSDNPVARDLLNQFMADHEGDETKQWVDSANKTFQIAASNGDTLELLSDGRFYKRHNLGTASVETEYNRDGSIRNQVSVQMRAEGDGPARVLINRKSAGLDVSVELDAANSQTISGVTKVLDAQGNVLQRTVYERMDNGSLESTVYDANNRELYRVNSQSFEDGSALEIKTESGQQYVRSVMRKADGSSETIASEWKNLTTGQTHTQEQAENTMYSDMASFIGAMRSQDALGQLLYGAKIAIDFQIKNGSTNPDLSRLNTAMTGLVATVGVVAGLYALQSNDPYTQVNGAVGLINNANILYSMTPGSEAGFLSAAESTALTAVGSVLAIANLRNLDAMIESGQVGSAAATVVYAAQGIAVLGAMATAAQGGALAAAQGAVFITPGVGLAIAVAAFALDSLTHKDPPPPPPVGEAWFVRDAAGGLTIQYGANCNELGRAVLAPRMQALLADLQTKVTEANKAVTDPSQALVLVASRIPKVIINSWVSRDNNGVSNFYFVAEEKLSIGDNKAYQAYARDDLVKFFSETLPNTEAVVQQWQAQLLKDKFGSDEAHWATESQWLRSRSPMEQQRSQLEATLAQAQATLQSAQEQSLVADAQTGVVTGGSLAAAAARTVAQAAAQPQLEAAQAALDAFNAQHPQDTQQAAWIVDYSGVNGNAEAMRAAREGATQQWLKVIALDWNVDGLISRITPSANVKSDLRSIQTDGVARFDVDSDGFREVTEWVGNTDAMFGMDRDGDGLITNAGELFNGAFTAFDMRGLASLKYFDSNNDGKLSQSDAVWKLLRIWIDINGDGNAGSMETFDLDMNYVGVDMAELKSGLDAAGQAAIEALHQLGVQEIDLSSYHFKLINGDILAAKEQQLKSDILGTQLLQDEATKNITVLKEKKDGTVERENYITFMQDLSVLQELQDSSISVSQRAELEDLARKYGLDPKAANFADVIKSLRVGGENVGGTGMTVMMGDTAITVNENLRQEINAARLGGGTQWEVLREQVFGVQQVQTPIWAGASSSTPQFNDGYVPAHTVVNAEVVGDVRTETPTTPNAERWVLPADVYNLDYLVRGAQQGGLVQQKAVVASKAGTQSTVKQTVQVYTSATPTLSLAAAKLQGLEDDHLSFGYVQLEQEARTLIPGASPLTTVKLLGIRDVRHGHVEMDDAAGIMRFVTDTDYVGADAGFTYVLADSTGRIIERQVQMDLAEVNDAPVVLGETVLAHEDVPLVFDQATLLANDTDKEGDALHIIGIGRVGMGRATLEQNGQIRYVPPKDLFGTTDTVEYLVQDARGAVSIGVIKITLTAVNDAPTVVSEVIRNAKEDVTLRIDTQLLLANDFDPDVDARVGGVPLRVTAVAGAEHGQVFLDAAGYVIFVPNENYHGTARFDYTATDATGLSTTGKAEVEIGAVNDGPVALGETISALEDQKLTINKSLLLANDTDTDIDLGEDQRLSIVAVDQAMHGTVQMVGTDIVFTPDANYNGEASFRYTLSDNAGGLSQAVVKIHVAAVNDAPTVGNKSFKGMEDTAIRIRASQLMAGATDVEDGSQGIRVSAVGNAQGGTLTSAFDASVGEIVYTFSPTADLNGVATFTYAVSDTQGGTSTGNVSIDLSAVNDKPLFLNGSKINASGEEDQQVRLSESALLKMFLDIEGDAMSVDVASLRALNAGDSVSFDAGKRELVFTPQANANGVRQIVLAVKDSAGLSSDPVTLDLNIASVNDRPVVDSVGFEALEDGGYTDGKSQAWNWVYFDTILSKATDADGDRLDISWVGNASVANTKLTIDSANRRVGFLGPLNYNGALDFQYTVTDGKGGNTTQTARGMVTAVDDLPEVSFENIPLPKIFQNEFRVGADSSNKWFRTAWRVNTYDVDTDVSQYRYAVNRAPTMTEVPRFGTTIAWGGKVGAPLFGKIGQTVGYTSYQYFYETSAAANYFTIVDSWGKQWAEQSFELKLMLAGSDAAVAVKSMSFAYWYDPIIVDLNNDGLEFIQSRDSKVQFDVDGDGKKDTIAWATPGDAILVYDFNGDNLVTGFDELAFGSHLNAPDPELSDLQVLAQSEFDTNQDGVFDARDAKWSSFKLWQDQNSNGVVDAGEMQSMAQAGVGAIHLQANILNRAYGTDVSVRGYTRVEMSDGRLLQAGDVHLTAAQDTNNLVPTDEQTRATALSAEDVQKLTNAWQQSHDALLHVGSGQFTGALMDQKTLVGQAYRYVLPNQLFADVPEGANYHIALANGDPLPSWLSYDATNRTLGGTPGEFQQGIVSIKVTVPGAAGAADLAVGSYVLEVARYNQAPVVYGQVPVQFALEDEVFSLEIAPNFFIDRDAADKLRFSAKLANGAPLPSWLHFNASTLAFEGKPAGNDVGALEIVLTARDAANAEASTQFSLLVEAANDAPTLAKGLDTFGLRAGQLNTYVLPLEAFADEDEGDQLKLSITKADGSALPSWLTYAPATRTLSGTPSAADVAAPFQLRVTATDLAGASVSTLLTLGSAQWGTSGNDVLTGSAISEYLWGEDGNDTLDGREGADVMVGGRGDDTYVADAFDTLLERAGEGTDTVRTALTWTLGDTFENLTLTGNDSVNGVGNSSNNVLIGNAAANVLEGGAGNDTLDGGAGADKLVGGIGDDTYMVDNAGDVVVENVNEGMDTVNASISYTLSDTLENLTLTGNAAISGTGNARDNVLIGNSASNFLAGGLGNDTYVFGRGYGQDTVYDYDTTTGNVDTVQIAGGVSVNDLIVTSNGNDLSLSIAGTNDRITLQNWRSNNFCRVEQVRFIDGTVWSADFLLAQSMIGSAGNDMLIGDSNANVLNGMAGNDYLQGGLGNDTYVFGRGFGLDSAYDYDNTAGNKDTVQLAAGVSVIDLIVMSNGSDLTLSISGTNDRMTLQYWRWGSPYQIEQVRFADGTLWNADDLVAQSCIGSTGDDTLIGDDKANMLDGKGGNDSLQGGSGNDTYIFGRGYGQDTVYDYDSTIGNFDTVKMAVGVSASDLIVKSSGTDLIICIAGTNDRLTLQSWLYSASTRIEKVQFSDGTAWNAEDLLSKALAGTAGDDTLYGNEGANVLDGKAGNDYLAGRSGNDTYVFGRGYGQDTVYDYDTTADNVDTVKIAAGVSVIDLIVRSNGNDLILSIAGTNDRMTLQSWNMGSAYRIEQVRFADGTLWNVDSLRIQCLTGSAGDDVLIGTDGADLLDGKAGNDTLSGGLGNDTYVFGRGYGEDQVDDYDTTAGNVDTLQIASGISTSDLIVRFGGWGDTDLVLNIAGTSDRMTLRDWHFDGNRRVEQVRFADGTVWNADALIARTMLGTAGDDILNGTSGADVLDGKAGNDALIGGLGNDTYVFGRGSDQDWAYDTDSTAGNLDTVQVAAGVSATDLIVTSTADSYYGGAGDLVLSIAGTNDRMTLTKWYKTENRIEQVRFADGTLWNADTLIAKACTGTSGNDTLFGNEGANVLDGKGGNDYLYGGRGNDTYIFGRGYGQDVLVDSGSDALNVLQFASNILPTDLVLKQTSAWNLEIAIAGTSDTLTIQSGASISPIAQFKFANGAIWNADTIFSLSTQGTAGDDFIVGNDLNNTLDGKGGNDALIGRSGNDTYFFGRNYGTDTVYDTDYSGLDVDTINFGQDVLSSQLWFKRYGNYGLEIDIVGTNDKILNNYYFISSGGNSVQTDRIEKFRSGDGKTLDCSDVDKLVQAMSAITPPPVGQINLSASQQTALAPALTACWK